MGEVKKLSSRFAEEDKLIKIIITHQIYIALFKVLKETKNMITPHTDEGKKPRRSTKWIDTIISCHHI